MAQLMGGMGKGPIKMAAIGRLPVDACTVLVSPSIRSLAATSL